MHAKKFRCLAAVAALTLASSLALFGAMPADGAGAPAGRVTTRSVDTTVDDNGPGPAALVTANGNRFLFWRGAGGSLWDAVNTSYLNTTGGWSKAHQIVSGKRADMTSEPTAAESETGTVYVFWYSGYYPCPCRLDMEYSVGGTGKWHGPYVIKTGDDIDSSTYAPSASAYGTDAGMIVAWFGYRHMELTGSTTPGRVHSWSKIESTGYESPPSGEPSLSNSALLGTLTVVAFWNGAGYSDLLAGTIPKLKGEPYTFKDGTLGSNVTSFSFADATCLCVFSQAFWEGTSGGLYGMSYSSATGNEPLGRLYAGQLGSTPSVIVMPGVTSFSIQAFWYWICPSKDNDGSICQFNGSKVTTLKLGPAGRWA